MAGARTPTPPDRPQKQKTYPRPSPRPLPCPRCPRTGRDRERTVRGDRVGWRVSRPPCRSSGRPAAPSGARAAISTTVASRAARGQNSLRGVGVPARKRPELAPWIWTAGISLLLREAGGSAIRWPGAAVPGKSRGPPERGGNSRSLPAGRSPVSICGRPLGAKPRRRSPLACRIPRGLRPSGAFARPRCAPFHPSTKGLGCHICRLGEPHHA